MDFTGRALSTQLKQADKLGAKYAVIIGKKEEEFRSLGHKLNNGRVFIDLVGMLKGLEHGGGNQGICW